MSQHFLDERPTILKAFNQCKICRQLHSVEQQSRLNAVETERDGRKMRAGKSGFGMSCRACLYCVLDRLGHIATSA